MDIFDQLDLLLDWFYTGIYDFVVDTASYLIALSVKFSLVVYRQSAFFAKPWRVPDSFKLTYLDTSDSVQMDQLRKCFHWSPDGVFSCWMKYRRFIRLISPLPRLKTLTFRAA